MSSIRFMMPSVPSDGTGPDSSVPSIPFGGVDPYNQLPHPVEMVKKAGAFAQRLARSMRPSRPATVPAGRSAVGVFSDS
jgi:hypothetical protein